VLGNFLHFAHLTRLLKVMKFGRLSADDDIWGWSVPVRRAPFSTCNVGHYLS